MTSREAYLNRDLSPATEEKLRMLKSRCRKTWCVSPHHAYQALDPADAPVIIAAWRAGDTHEAIAARYGCSRETVTRFIGAHISEVAA